MTHKTFPLSYGDLASIYLYISHQQQLIEKPIDSSHLRSLSPPYCTRVVVMPIQNVMLLTCIRFVVRCSFRFRIFTLTIKFVVHAQVWQFLFIHNIRLFTYAFSQFACLSLLSLFQCHSRMYSSCLASKLLFFSCILVFDDVCFCFCLVWKLLIHGSLKDEQMFVHMDQLICQKKFVLCAPIFYNVNF